MAHAWLSVTAARAGYLIVTLVALSCDGAAREASREVPDRTGSARAGPVTPPAPAEATGPIFMFSSTAEERARLDEALSEFAQRRAAFDLREGRIYRLTLDSVPGRYLILAPMSGVDSKEMRTWGLAFTAIETGGGAPIISASHDFRGLEVISVQAVRDIDGDGAADVVFCGGYEGQDEPSALQALGVRNGRWYSIDVPPPNRRRPAGPATCTPTGSSGTIAAKAAGVADADGPARSSAAA